MHLAQPPILLVVLERHPLRVLLRARNRPTAQPGKPASAVQARCYAPAGPPRSSAPSTRPARRRERTPRRVQAPVSGPRKHVLPRSPHGIRIGASAGLVDWGEQSGRLGAAVARAVDAVLADGRRILSRPHSTEEAKRVRAVLGIGDALAGQRQPSVSEEAWLVVLDRLDPGEQRFAQAVLEQHEERLDRVAVGRADTDANAWREIDKLNALMGVLRPILAALPETTLQTKSERPDYRELRRTLHAEVTWYEDSLAPLDVAVDLYDGYETLVAQLRLHTWLTGVEGPQAVQWQLEFVGPGHPEADRLLPVENATAREAMGLWEQSRGRPRKQRNRHGRHEPTRVAGNRRRSQHKGHTPDAPSRTSRSGPCPQLGAQSNRRRRDHRPDRAQRGRPARASTARGRARMR